MIGADAHRLLPAAAGAPPRVIVLLLGETARAPNFSLFGYERPTNRSSPRSATSSRSATSPPRHLDRGLGACMFSRARAAPPPATRRRSASEGVLNVLARARLRGALARQPVRLQGRLQGRGHHRKQARRGLRADLCRGGEGLLRRDPGARARRGAARPEARHGVRAARSATTVRRITVAIPRHSGASSPTAASTSCATARASRSSTPSTTRSSTPTT